MTFSMSRSKIIEMYRCISKSLSDPSLLRQLQEFFDENQTLVDLLEWIHGRVKFEKGDIARNTDPLEIVRYGRGKCREFSVLYTALCLANGYRARLILDMSDHVWSEIWDFKQMRWIHVDPSEKKIDDPGMYERDWKKTLKEVYAFENGEFEDVTEHYKIADCSLKNQTR